MYYLQTEDHFSSAHQLREYRGKCENLHGHNWRVLVRVRGARLDATGMLLDFGDLKNIVHDVLEGLDHTFLNDTPPFDRINPTAENLACYIFTEVESMLPKGVYADRVMVWESEKSCAIYGADE